MPESERKKHPHYRYDDEELVSVFADLVLRLGRRPTQIDVDSQPDMPSWRTFYRRLGRSGMEAVIGASVIHIMPNRDFSEDDVYESLLHFMRLNAGAPPTSRQCTSQHGLPSRPTIEKATGLAFSEVISRVRQHYADEAPRVAP